MEYSQLPAPVPSWLPAKSLPLCRLKTWSPHQLLLLQRLNQDRRLRLRSCDRLLWIWLSRVWSNWRSALRIVKPETVIAPYRQGFRRYQARKSRARSGRPSLILKGGRILVRNTVEDRGSASCNRGTTSARTSISRVAPGLSPNVRITDNYPARHRQQTGIRQSLDDDLGTNPKGIAQADCDRGLDSRGHGFAFSSERARSFSSAMRRLAFSTVSPYPGTVGWELRRYCRIISSA